MIDQRTLTQINAKLEAKRRIEQVLRDFENRYVETTVGLIKINSASKCRALHCEEHATWMHCEFPEIEAELKARTAALLRSEVAKIDAWLSERVVG